jgi:3-hydroxyisobutyrate dehydrogenase
MSTTQTDERREALREAFVRERERWSPALDGLLARDPDYLERFLDVLNNSSGVNFATLKRFPSIIKGDYLEGGLTGALMAKDLRLYLEHVARIGVPTFTGPACLATFEVANAAGYGEQISNRVVDALGDLAGGIRLQDGAGAEGS